MKYILSLVGICLIIGSTSLFAQETYEVTSEELREYATSKVIRTKSSKAVKGSPYLKDEWIKGYVMLTEMAKTENLFLRYDMENNMVEFLRNKKIYAMDPRKINGFVILTGSEDIIFKKGFSSDEHDINSQTQLRIIQDGGIKFVAHYTSSLKKDLATYGSATRRDEYVNDTDYYIISEDNTFQEIKLRRRDILRKLEDKETQIKEFVRQNNLDYDKVNHVAQIVAYYNGLKTQS